MAIVAAASGTRVAGLTFRSGALLGDLAFTKKSSVELYKAYPKA